MPRKLAFLCVLQLLLSISTFPADVRADDSYGAPPKHLREYLDRLRKHRPIMSKLLLGIVRLPSIFQLGVAYAGSGDWQAAIAQYRKAADRGLSAAQLNLGEIYDFGHGVPQNYQQAAALYRKACEAA
jgi:TPR repeat protein